jgi:hypothetical protein
MRGERTLLRATQGKCVAVHPEHNFQVCSGQIGTVYSGASTGGPQLFNSEEVVRIPLIEAHGRIPLCVNHQTSPALLSREVTRHGAVKRGAAALEQSVRPSTGCRPAPETPRSNFQVFKHIRRN